MRITSKIVILCALCVVRQGSWAAPVQGTDIFSGFLRDIYLNAPPKESEVVKRRVLEQDPDSESDLKQISLRALIDDVESSLYNSALSVRNVGHDNSAIVPEITPPSADHTANKREIDEVDVQGATTTENPRILLQTTAKVPTKGSYPGHVLIDRISVQPYFSGLPIIPAFQVHHSKLIPEGSNATTQISITKKTLSSSANDKTTEASETTTTQESNKSVVATTIADKTPAPSTTSTTTSSSSTSTTPNLQKVEAELKEKVAEIEAEPIILSARI